MLFRFPITYNVAALYNNPSRPGLFPGGLKFEKKAKNSAGRFLCRTGDDSDEILDEIINERGEDTHCCLLFERFISFGWNVDNYYQNYIL